MFLLQQQSVFLKPSTRCFALNYVAHCDFLLMEVIKEGAVKISILVCCDPRFAAFLNKLKIKFFKKNLLEMDKRYDDTR